MYAIHFTQQIRHPPDPDCHYWNTNLYGQENSPNLQIVGGGMYLYDEIPFVITPSMLYTYKLGSHGSYNYLYRSPTRPSSLQASDFSIFVILAYLSARSS